MNTNFIDKNSALPESDSWQSGLALTPSEILLPASRDQNDSVPVAVRACSDAGLRITANYPQHINAGISGDCATYHIEDVIIFPSNKRGGFETRQSREDGVCLKGDCFGDPIIKG